MNTQLTLTKERLDRSVIYHSKTLFELLDKFCEEKKIPKISKSLFIEGLLFLSFLTKSKHPNLDGCFEFDISEFSSCLGKTKQAVSKSVDGFLIEKKDSSGRVQKLQNQVEYFLYIMFQFDFPSSEIYNNNYFRWYKPGSNTIIQELYTPIVKEENNRKINYGKKKYMITINPNFKTALIKQFSIIDLNKITALKTSKNSYIEFVLLLLKLYNTSIAQSTNISTPHINLLAKEAGYNFDNYAEENKHKKFTKVIKLLNRCKELNIVPIQKIERSKERKDVILIVFDLTPQINQEQKNLEDSIIRNSIIINLKKEVFNEYKENSDNESLTYSEWLQLEISWKEIVNRIFQYFSLNDENYIKLLKSHPSILYKSLDLNIDFSQFKDFLKAK